MADTGRMPEGPYTLEEQNRMLLRFAKAVRDSAEDLRLVEDAEELVILFGDPDKPKPTGVIRP